MTVMMRTILHAHHEAENHQGHAVNTGDEGVENEQKEILVVANTHAIVHPWTVMIHLDNASSTNTDRE